MEASAQLSRPPWPASRPLRDWQQRALAQVRERPAGAFLASATPAAGKTTFGLRVAHDLLSRGAVRRVCVVAPTVHICRQWARRGGFAGHRPRARPAQRRGPRAGRLRRCGRHLRLDRGRPGAARAHREVARHAADRRRAAPHGRAGRLGPGRRAGLHPRALPAAAVGHAVSVRQHGDPLGHLRRRGRQLVRLRLLVHRRAGGRGLPADHLPRLRRRDGVGLRRPPAPVRLRHRPAARRVGPPAAHGARPRGRLDRERPARRRPAARRGARRRPRRRGRAGGGRRQGARGRAGRPAGRDHREAASRGHLRRPGRLGRDRPLRRRRRALAGVGADGQRGRRRAPPARGRVRHRRAHRAVLPPGGGPLRAPHPHPAAADELPVPARRPRAQGAGRPGGGGAPPRAGAQPGAGGARGAQPSAQRTPAASWRCPPAPGWTT